MVFNPVYIQKTNDGESQLLGSAFTNQKPTHLFSDIIKVILSKSEQASTVDKSAGGDQSENHDSAVSINSIFISDKEVELYDKLMKINLNFGDTGVQPEGDSTKLISVFENLKMFLKGLTDQEETTSDDSKGFEIDKNDLAVVLDIFTGNMNNINIEENNFGSEMNDFLKEINGFLESTDLKPGQKLIVAQNDFTLEISPTDNGKLFIKLSELQTPAAQNKEVTIAVDGKTEQIIMAPENKVAADSGKNNVTQIKVDKGSKPSFNVKDVESQSSSKPTDIFENVKIETAKSNTTNDSSEIKKSVNDSIDAKPIEVSGKDKFASSSAKALDNNSKVYENSVLVNKEKPENVIKIVTDNSDKSSSKTIEVVDKTQIKAAPKPEIKQPVSKDLLLTKSEELSQTIKPVKTAEFFEGKIKIEVYNSTVKSSNDNKNIAGDNSVNEITKNTNAAADDTLVKQIFRPNDVVLQSKIASVTNLEKNVELPKVELSSETDKKIIVSSEVESNTTNKELPSELLKTKPSLLKEEKENGAATKLPETTLKEQAVKTDKPENINQEKIIEAMPVDKKTTTDNLTHEKLDSEKIDTEKSKLNKTVLPAKESDQQKTDSQQQNSFDKTFVGINKTEHLGKEIKETVKVVEQAKLLKEIENVIKNGDKKVVKINIYPEELGSVKVSLDINNKSVSAKINVTNDSVRQMILTQSESLKSSLSQSGIELASLNVSVNNSDEKSTHQGKMKKKEGFSDKKVVLKNIPGPVKVKNLGYNTYDYVV